MSGPASDDLPGALSFFGDLRAHLSRIGICSYAVALNNSGVGDQLLCAAVVAKVCEAAGLSFRGLVSQSLASGGRSESFIDDGGRIYVTLGISTLPQIARSEARIIELAKSATPGLPGAIEGLRSLFALSPEGLSTLCIQIPPLAASALIALFSASGINYLDNGFSNRLRSARDGRREAGRGALSNGRSDARLRILLHLRLGDVINVSGLVPGHTLIPFDLANQRLPVPTHKIRSHARYDRWGFFRRLSRGIRARYGADAVVQMITDGPDRGFQTLRRHEVRMFLESHDLAPSEPAIDSAEQRIGARLAADFAGIDTLVCGEGLAEFERSIQCILDADVIVSSSGHFVLNVLNNIKSSSQPTTLCVFNDHARFRVSVDTVEIVTLTGREPEDLETTLSLLRERSAALRKSLSSQAVGTRDHRESARGSEYPIRRPLGESEMPINCNLRPFLNDVFIETGSFKGDGIQRALDAGFPKVVSIEVHGPHHEHCRKRFAAEIAAGRVELLLGHSEDRLPQVCAELQTPATFWLDAHPMKEGAGRNNCPLYDELTAVKASPVGDHTVLIDDVRLIRKPGAWHGHDIVLGALFEQLIDINPDYQIYFENGHIAHDVLVACPRKKASRGDHFLMFDILRRLGLKPPRSILHIGANTGQEIPLYVANKVRRALYVEAMPTCFRRLRTRLTGIPGHRAVRACVTATDGKDVQFNVCNVKAASSMLPLSNHSRLFPSVHAVRQIQMKGVTLDTLLSTAPQARGLAPFDTIVIDVQGAEDEVFLGGSATLTAPSVRNVFCEVTESALFEGGSTLASITGILSQHGFSLKDLHLNRKGWGDALFTRDSVVAAFLDRSTGAARRRDVA